jgi:hypothetical protein
VINVHGVDSPLVRWLASNFPSGAKTRAEAGREKSIQDVGSRRMQSASAVNVETAIGIPQKYDRSTFVVEATDFARVVPGAGDNQTRAVTRTAEIPHVGPGRTILQ